MDFRCSFFIKNGPFVRCRETADTATDEGSFTTVLSNIEKVSKVFNYMARIFSSTSAMLNNFITIYNTVKQLNEFISNNF